MALTPAEKKKLIEETAANVAEEETLAAAREIERKRNTKDAIIPVRLTPELYSSVQSIANSRRVSASAIIRQWIAEGVATADNHVDIASELERLATILRAEHV